MQPLLPCGVRAQNDGRCLDLQPSSAAGSHAVVRLQVMRDFDTKQSRGFGFVTFAHAASAGEAMARLNGVQLTGPFQGRPLKVSPSTRAR